MSNDSKIIGFPGAPEPTDDPQKLVQVQLIARYLAATRREADDLRTELLCVCEKIEAGCQLGPEDAKRIRNILHESAATDH